MGEEVVPSIFLSHSGEEKGFVERLHEALLAVNHKPFFDMVSLNRGEGLSDPILRAAAGCQVGVVVLSPTFMTKKWPMLEMHTMRCHGVPNILPVFYKLTPGDFTQPLPKAWTDAWAVLPRCDTSGWSDTARHITSILGPVFKRGSSELAFIHEIVHDICKLIPPPPSYDLARISGQEHLTETVVSMFEEAQPLCRSASGACVVGLHGIGGFGKTTLCKLMVNHYNSATCRCAWIEFPLDGNKDQIIMAFKNFLLDLLKERNDGVHNFDQLLGIMTEALKRHTVFIALDNVSDHSMEYALRFLELKFSRGSKVVVTSRSQEVLRELLVSRGCDEQMCVFQCPGLSDEREGLRILQDAFGPSFSVQISDNLAFMQRLLKLCLFDGWFHPLALQALGGRLRRLWATDQAPGSHKKNVNLAPLEHELERLEKRTRSTLHFASHVLQVIKSSYDTITPLRQKMFLDVALIFIPYFQGKRRVEIHAGFPDLCEWLCALYNEGNLDDVKDHVTQLAFDGLLQFARSGRALDDYSKIVKVHDLYVELARNEADVTRKGCYVTGLPGNIEDIQWEEAGRICIDFLACENAELYYRGIMNELSQHRCPKLQVLIVESASTIDSGRVVLNLKCMPDLRVLVFHEVVLKKGRLTGWGNASRLGWLELSDCEWSEQFSVEPIPKTLSHLRTVNLPSIVETEGVWKGPPEMRSSMWTSGGAQLSTLVLHGDRLLAGCPAAISFSNLRTLELQGNFYKFEQSWHHRLRNARRIIGGLTPDDPSALVRLDLSALIHLESLVLCSLWWLREVVGFSTLAKLSCVAINRCESLQELVVLNMKDSPACGNNMSSSCSMESLGLTFCPDSCQIQGISGLTNLRSLYIYLMVSTSPCPPNLDLTELPLLEKLEMRYISQGYSQASMSLASVRVNASLRSLSLSGCTDVEHILASGIPALESLSISVSDAVTLDASNFPRLKELNLCSCEFLEEIAGIQALTNLQQLRIYQTNRLKIHTDLLPASVTIVRNTP